MTSRCPPRQGERRPHGRGVVGDSAERRVSRGGSCLQRTPPYSAVRCCTEVLEGPPTCEIWAELSQARTPQVTCSAGPSQGFRFATPPCRRPGTPGLCWPRPRAEPSGGQSQRREFSPLGSAEAPCGTLASWAELRPQEPTCVLGLSWAQAACRSRRPPVGPGHVCSVFPSTPSLTLAEGS